MKYETATWGYIWFKTNAFSASLKLSKTISLKDKKDNDTHLGEDINGRPEGAIIAS